MLDKLFESLPMDNTTFHVVKLDLNTRPNELTDELNAASIQSDMTLVSQNYLTSTNELVLIFASNNKTRMETAGDFLQNLLNLEDEEETEESVEDIEAWLKENGIEEDEEDAD